ncbi:prolyl-tRNA editing enzyme YbaK/EbsC (Cys-tRNA(Pro) deacylase) [Knoellia remsis]|uniref:Prolyl-tRNA editing enzyme YbaK/EbsC (Cys-tRNA(Pro) deacylase) n=1 Tax=Knoellia remsis TaxID=407159 RepID=A0A2T0UXH4_9MICO|nr:YbaK/EbsC family protein [Knoellia remsis]PRY62626.1 prolyl-tRNA editing enzyme YbaK/EbsC (Cys-tRNA(Pro) deacylase) [Knoellia remsis]
MTEPGELVPERDLSTHPSVAVVLNTLAAHHISPTVRYLPDAVRTARAAADALGVTPAEIANSLVFAGQGHDGSVEPVLVLASGGHRVDEDRVAGLLDLAALDKATPEQVRQWTGFAIGGVAPIGHPAPLRTVVDVTLGGFDHVWAAAGHSHSVFETTYDELLRITGGKAIEVD